MTRFRLTIEYDGRPFVGWQRQSRGASVQQAVEDAVHAITGERTAIHAAGRTDAGVHALAMSAHVDIARDINAFRFGEGLNAKLLRSCGRTKRSRCPGWHARSAAPPPLPVSHHQRRPPLALAGAGLAGRRHLMPMRCMTCPVVVGHHDFTTFRSAHCQSEARKRRSTGSSARDETDLISAAARSFLLTSPVEVGCRDVGRGKWRRSDLETRFRRVIVPPSAQCAADGCISPSV